MSTIVVMKDLVQTWMVIKNTKTLGRFVAILGTRA